VLPRVSVEVQPGCSVGDVTASGHSPFNTFALVTPEMEPDFARAGDDHMITGVYNLFGIDDRRAIRFQGADHLTWASSSVPRKRGSIEVIRHASWSITTVDDLGHLGLVEFPPQLYRLTPTRPFPALQLPHTFA
jgi:hypothetical protein